MIWPGLSFIFKAWKVREHTGTSLSYPFRHYPLPRGHDVGTFNQAMMNGIGGLWARLKPMAKTGGQVRLNAIEVRIAILSARVNLKSRRHEAQLMRGKDAETRRRRKIERASIAKLRKKTRPVIKSLENAMKKANRRFIKLVSKKDLDSQSQQWQAHLRWMKYHILYFKPFPPVVPGHRLYRMRLDQLVAAAEAGLQDQAYELPSKEELRRMMRRYARYSRRDRMGANDFRLLLKDREEDWKLQWALVEFLEKQLDLKQVSDESVMSSEQPAQEDPEQAVSERQVPETVETKPPFKAPLEKRGRLKLKLSPEQKRRLAELWKNRPRPTQTSPS